MKQLSLPFLLLIFVGTCLPLQAIDQDLKGLINAAYTGNIEQVKNFLPKVTDPNEYLRAKESGIPGYQLNALSAASLAGKNDIIGLLLSPTEAFTPKKEIDINSSSPGTGDTALHLAVMGENTSTVELLLDQGANIDSQNKQGNTPLHLAAQKALPDIVELLVKNGAKINLKNKKDETPSKIVPTDKQSAIRSAIERGLKSMQDAREREQLERERLEREAKEEQEQRERETREQEEREQREREERERREREEHERREQEEREARERLEREQREREEHERPLDEELKKQLITLSNKLITLTKSMASKPGIDWESITPAGPKLGHPTRQRPERTTRRPTHGHRTPGKTETAPPATGPAAMQEELRRRLEKKSNH